MNSTFFYYLTNEVYKIFEVIYRVEQKYTSIYSSMFFFILLSISAIYGSHNIKILVFLLSFTIMIITRKNNIKNAIHVYFDLLFFVALITLPAAIIKIIEIKSFLSTFYSIANTMFNVITASSPTIAMAMIIGVRELAIAISRFSKFLGTIFNLTIVVLPKIIQYVNMIINARIARTIKLSRLKIIKILTISLADTIAYGTLLTYQTMLAIKARSFIETVDLLVKISNRIKPIDILLITISIIILFMAVMKWL